MLIHPKKHPAHSEEINFSQKTKTWQHPALAAKDASGVPEVIFADARFQI